MTVACISLAVALSGASYAAIVLPKNSVGTKQIRNNAVKSTKIAPNQVKGVDVDEATLGQVPSAANANNAANTANAANAANADKLDGLDAHGLTRFAFADTRMIVAMTTTATTYVTMTLTAPQAGFVKVDASFTAIQDPAGSCGMNAFLMHANTGAVSVDQEATAVDVSDGNLALTHVFQVSAGANQFQLQVYEDDDCDLFTNSGQISGIYSPFGSTGA